MDEICTACGIQPENFKPEGKDLGEWIGMQNFKIVERKIETIFNTASLQIPKEKIQN
ncbi:MAG: hypothetical protein HWD61_01380 [Parachlamydiaceae bacterium]|nr:MAG: hypothetical protein HWD61_01380 [Parachlamydiaceae bacterium]